MGVHWPIVFNLVNSVVGVSVLAIPYCFHECGIILGTLVMLGSSWVSKKSCLLLLTAGQIGRRRSYESLAQHAYGAIGKLAVEASIIGLCFGMLCAFNVIIGDLAPSIVNHIVGSQPSGSGRALVMILLALGIGLPLSLTRNISSLAAVSAMSLVFYSGFVTQTIFSALPHLIDGSWMSQVNYWKLSGLLKCLPIFSMAYTCQTQLFVLYDSLPEPSVKKMDEVVNTAMNLVSFVYLSVGTMCYITYTVGVKGDVLINYGDSFIAEILQTGFVMSVIVSIPLITFPMRASVNSLLFPSQTAGTENMPGGPGYMPQNRFVAITVSLICVTLAIGILIPQIEFVLGLTGATMGTLTAFIFPAVIFLFIVSDTQNNLRRVAQILLGVGLICLVCSTYSVLNAPSSSHDNNVVDTNINVPDVGKLKAHPFNNSLPRGNPDNPIKAGPVDLKGIKDNMEQINAKLKPAEEAAKDGVHKKDAKLVGKRVEPAVPHPPEEKGAQEKKAADPVNEKRQLMSVGDPKVSKTKEQVEKPAAQDKPVVQDKPAEKTVKQVNLDPKVEVSEEEINAEIAQLKEKKAEVDEDIKNLENLKGDNVKVKDTKGYNDKVKDSKGESRGKRDVEGDEKVIVEKHVDKDTNVPKTKPTEVHPPAKSNGGDNIPVHPSPTPVIVEASSSSSMGNDTGRGVKIRDLKSSEAVDESKNDKSRGKRDVGKKMDYSSNRNIRSLWGMKSMLMKRRGLRTAKGGVKIEVR